jgi:dynein heavy chain, axonemal
MVLKTTVTKFVTPDDIKLERDEEEEKDDEEGSQKGGDDYEGAIFIHGLFLEGATWELNARIGYLTEMKPKELHPLLPVIAVNAVLMSQKSMKAQYECPVYYTTQRGPTYVFTANMSMESDELKEKHKWVLAGVAAIMNEDF